MIYVRSFNGIHYLFQLVPIPRSFKPAVGAALAGAVGVAIYFGIGRQLAALSVLSYGYGVLLEGLQDEPPLSAALLLAIAVGEILTTSLTIGRGGSGRGFRPSKGIGGCAGTVS